MFVLPVGSYAPVEPIARVAPVTPRKAKAVDKSTKRQAVTRPARSAFAIASHSTRAALADIKLGG
jgi:hypothetical protein